MVITKNIIKSRVFSVKNGIFYTPITFHRFSLLAIIQLQPEKGRSASRKGVELDF